MLGYKGAREQTEKVIFMLRFSILKRLGSLCALAVAFSIGSASHAATIVVDQDTVIDASNSFPNDHTRIVDGPNPTHVNVISGGEVRGFTVTGNSVLEINGGKSTFLSGIQDNATLIMRSGNIGCTSFPTCMVIDYDALVHIAGQSSLYVYGGNVDGSISLTENSTAHFYGRDLTLVVSPSGGIVEGELASGETAYFSVFTTIDASTRIFLHQIPEPDARILLTVAAILFLMQSHFRS